MSKAGKQSAVEAKSGPSTGVLVGRFDRALDSKKRLTVPSEWRLALGSPDYVYVVPDPEEECLNLIPKEVMESRLEELKKASLFDRDLNAALQAIGENSELLAFDVQGRIRICDKLLAHASLAGTVAMVGAFRMAKLWSPAKLVPDAKVDLVKLRAAVSKLKF